MTEWRQRFLGTSAAYAPLIARLTLALVILPHGLQKTIGMFGVDRCMFASNYPVDSVKASWDWIYGQFKYVTAGLPQEDRRKLFAGNAAAFYRITLPLV